MSTAVAAASRFSLPQRFAELLPGVVLLLTIGYSGRLIELSFNAYGKANHLALPNIEYVLWAIAIGLIVSNTVGVPKIFKPGIATYEFFLKFGIVLLGVRFLVGDVLKLGGISPALEAARLCQRRGLGVNVAAKVAESSIASAAAIHLACAAPAVDWGVSLTHFYLAEDVVKNPLKIGNGVVSVPTGPGLGIEVDETQVERFRIAVDAPPG